MLILAHRGAHEPETEGVRENTLDAFRAAADLGADGVELDVRRSADGVLVVHHDAAVPGGEVIAGTPAAGLPPWLPTLAAALDATAFVNVEIKNSPFDPDFDGAHAIAGEVAAALDGRGSVLVSSFNLATLDAYRAADERTPTGWLTVPGYDQLAALRSVADNGHRAVNPPYEVVTAELVAGAREAGVQVVAWTVNEPAAMERLAALGVDVVITDRPALAVATLR